MSSPLHPDVDSVLFSAEELRVRVKELGAAISKDYQHSDGLVVVGILKGSFIFMSDLIRTIDVPNVVEFMSLSSYGNSTQSTGEVRIIMDLRTPIEGKDVLIVEDIVDTGLTLNYLLGLLSSRKAKSVSVAVLLKKKEALQVDVPVKYCGFDIPLVFVVGYGLDYAERYRSLPYVGVLKPSVYAKKGDA